MAILVDRVEDDSLPLPEGAEHGTLERPWPKEHLGAVDITDNDPGTSHGIVGLDDTLVHVRP